MVPNGISPVDNGAYSGTLTAHEWVSSPIAYVWDAGRAAREDKQLLFHQGWENDGKRTTATYTRG